MLKIISLFSSSAAAGEAVETLAKLDIAEDEMELIERLPEPVEKESPLPLVAASPATKPAAGAAPLPDGLTLADPLADADLSDEEADFFRRGIRDGGSLLMVAVREAQASAVKAVMEAHGGRFMAA